MRFNKAHARVFVCVSAFPFVRLIESHCLGTTSTTCRGRPPPYFTLYQPLATSDVSLVRIMIKLQLATVQMLLRTVCTTQYTVGEGHVLTLNTLDNDSYTASVMAEEGTTRMRLGARPL
jgi:hypothetical protein